MVVTLNAVVVSGQSATDAQPYVYITYDSNLQNIGLPYPNTGNLDQIPGFMYLMGDVQFRQDSQGNLRAINPNKDGSLPV
jgi:hypothetical protein